MNGWTIGIIIYLVVAFVSFTPKLRAILKKVKLFPGGASFDESPYFLEAGKRLLNQHYSRIQGTLIFWKNQAEKYRLFHYY